MNFVFVNYVWNVCSFPILSILECYLRHGFKCIHVALSSQFSQIWDDLSVKNHQNLIEWIWLHSWKLIFITLYHSAATKHLDALKFKSLCSDLLLLNAIKEIDSVNLLLVRRDFACIYRNATVDVRFDLNWLHCSIDSFLFIIYAFCERTKQLV